MTRPRRGSRALERRQVSRWLVLGFGVVIATGLAAMHIPRGDHSMFRSHPAGLVSRDSVIDQSVVSGSHPDVPMSGVAHTLELCVTMLAVSGGLLLLAYRFVALTRRRWELVRGRTDRRVLTSFPPWAVLQPPGQVALRC